MPPSTLTQISCPATAANACLAIGSDNKGAVIVAGTPSGTAPSTWFADTLPNGPVSGVKPSSLTQITCPATAANACLAIGSDSSGAVVVAGTQSATSQTWQADTLPGGVAGLSQITCFNGAPCVATGVGATTAAIVTGTLANTSETFGGGVFTVGPSQPLYLSGIACFAGATPTCEAAGASTTGSLVLSDANITPPRRRATGPLPPYPTSGAAPTTSPDSGSRPCRSGCPTASYRATSSTWPAPRAPRFDRTPLPIRGW